MAWLKGCVAVVFVTAALVAAFSYFVVWPYFHPHANLRIENHADTNLHLTVSGTSECSAGDVLARQTSSNVRFDFDGLDCLGSSAESIEFRFWFLDAEGVAGVSSRQWTCEWRAAERVEPVIVTVDGPSCD